MARRRAGAGHRLASRAGPAAALKDVKKKLPPGASSGGVARRPDRTVLRPRADRRPSSRTLIVGMVLVTLILLICFGRTSAALIVAINVPLAAAGRVLNALSRRGRSANCFLSAPVDFGIIVDSSVIARREHLSPPHLERKKHRNSANRSSALLKSNAACSSPPSWSARSCRCSRCADPEEQDLRPDGRRTPSPSAVRCSWPSIAPGTHLFFKDLKPIQDNFMVKWLKSSYLRRLK